MTFQSLLRNTHPSSDLYLRSSCHSMERPESVSHSVPGKIRKPSFINKAFPGTPGAHPMTFVVIYPGAKLGANNILLSLSWRECLKVIHESLIHRYHFFLFVFQGKGFPFKFRGLNFINNFTMSVFSPDNKPFPLGIHDFLNSHTQEESTMKSEQHLALIFKTRVLACFNKMISFFSIQKFISPGLSGRWDFHPGKRIVNSLIVIDKPIKKNSGISHISMSGGIGNVLDQFVIPGDSHCSINRRRGDVVAKVITHFSEMKSHAFKCSRRIMIPFLRMIKKHLDPIFKTSSRSLKINASELNYFFESFLVIFSIKRNGTWSFRSFRKSLRGWLEVIKSGSVLIKSFDHLSSKMSSKMSTKTTLTRCKRNLLAISLIKKGCFYRVSPDLGSGVLWTCKFDSCPWYFKHQRVTKTSHQRGIIRVAKRVAKEEVFA